MGLIYEKILQFNETDYSINVKSVENEKVFIKINQGQILPQTTFSINKIVDYTSTESINNRIHEINTFIECCEKQNDDINCNMFGDGGIFDHLYNNEEIAYLDSLIENFSFIEKDLEENKFSLGFNTEILINEVYDSIAVGNIINYNENSCIQVTPGDNLSPIK